MSDTDIRSLVQHHDKQLNSLDTRMGHVEVTLKDHGGDLKVIRDAVTKQDSRPQFDLRYFLDIAKNFTVLFAAVCAGILYLASRNGEVDLAVIKKDQDSASQRLERMESLILPERWAGKTERFK